ncbi:MAG TPA: hypothetical protein VEZ12_18450, partial [Herpetosiphonaceae bacterium]|nr:hypothetical protein [Herpetosiphonaceae bacterium]
MFLLHQKIWSTILLLVIAFVSLVATRPAAAQTIDGRFGEYWQEHGGLPIFGHAISGQTFEANRDTGRRHLTQWFERNRFELHEANGRPYDVLLGRLGVDRLQQLGRDWQRLPEASPSAPHYFPETRHAIAHDPFWRYWSSHGLELDGRAGTSREESLALFGLPISEPAIETNTSGDRVLTQWFERARFEDHGAKGVLLGLLGNEVRNGAAPQVPVSRLQYFWPRTSPLTVWPSGSYADERSFVLNLAWPHATEPDATISGGAIAPPPEGAGTPVTVRGQRGTLHTLGARLALSWTEGGQFYMIMSTLRQNELVALANDLEALDLQTFRARLQPAPQPPRGLQYFWPRTSPLTVW